MQNYHDHSSFSNIMTPDSSVLNEDYAKRAVEIGHKIISSVEHGFQGYYYETFELAEKYNLKFIFGAEAYWVKDRFEKDRTNAHIILLAKNETGRRAINRILSDANEEGYYYRPRVDIELLLSLPPEDVFVTTACVAFWIYEDIENIVLQLHNHFKENFMLEVQYHWTEKQKKLNKLILELSEKHEIEIIAGMDSHYIYPEQAKERDYVLAAKGVHYDDEDGWFMDYPDDKTTMDRFIKQGILNIGQIQKAMNNTDIVLTFEDIVLNKDIKLPTLYPDKTQDEKNKIYSTLITNKFKEYMKSVPKEEYDRYFDGVKNEVQVIKNTGMADYFLFDYEIVKRAEENGGIITNSGRGSGVGYFTNTLLGFSKVDRFTSPIKLYPERFISESRILETKSLPDLDMNCGNPEVFAEAQEQILGTGHAYPMIAFGTFKKKSAFKLYARAKDLDFTIANEISEQIGKYDEAIKYADDDEKDDIDIYDYVDKKYHDYVTQSKPYWGVISDKKKAPCFAKDTLVMTNNGYKPIQNITTNDFVLTHTNTYKEVLHTMNKLSSTINKLKTKGREELLVTDEHPLYVRELHVERFKQNNGNWSKRKQFDEPQWKDVKDLKYGDIIGSAINQNNIIPNFYGLEKQIDNKNFWWIIGRYVGDGWTEYYEPENRARVKICCSKKNNEVEDIINRLEGLFNYRIDEERTVYKILIKNNIIFDFLQLFGKYANKKYLPSMIYDLPCDLLEEFLNGYFSADGHFQKTTGLYIISTVSRELAYGIQSCIHKVYHRPTTFSISKSGIDIIEGRMVNRKTKYIVKFRKHRHKNDVSFYENGYIWYKYISQEKINHQDYVYNLEVKDDNSYTVNNLIAHNCGYLLYQGNIKEEIGLIKCKSETTKKEYITTVVDGAIAEDYKFLKNDLLKVDVVLLIDEIYKRIGIKSHTVNELMNIVKDNEKVWDIYKNGFTIGVNQIEKESTKKKMMKYQAKNISELSAFIAAIRPAFKSMYKKFESREHFSYGIKAFDSIIQTVEFPQSFILYQEQTMNTLNYAGFPIDECYGIIKAISKKHPEKVRPLKDKFIEGFKEKIKADDNVSEEEAIDMSDKVWQIISDSCGYGFNSAHAFCMALDSLYGAYLKAFYPYEFYEVMLKIYSDKGKKDKVSELKQEMLKAFNIKEGKFKWGSDNRKFVADKDNSVIYSSLLSIKGLSQKCADDLYKLSKNKNFDNFYDLLKALKTVKSLDSSKINTLIEIGYFDEFGTIGKIQKFIKCFDDLYERSQFSKNDISEDYKNYIIKYSDQTEKQYRNFDYDKTLKELWNDLSNKDISLNEKIRYEFKHLGYIQTILPSLTPEYAFVQEYECKFKNPKLILFRLCNGDIDIVKVKRKQYDDSPIKVGDIIKTIECSNEGRWFKDKDDEWYQDKDDKETILKKWSFVK